ncbi:MAG: hypothetical protein KDG52_18725 [Rhodocyclaceae bacterium]|nr:hypothetical protein [Rhodocyclaceae bacterium]
MFAVTERVGPGDERLQAVREQAGQMVLKNIDNADFSGFTSTIYGRRMNAASAWRSSL